jgi:hypothetical protein
MLSSHTAAVLRSAGSSDILASGPPLVRLAAAHVHVRHRHDPIVALEGRLRHKHTAPLLEKWMCKTRHKIEHDHAHSLAQGCALNFAAQDTPQSCKLPTLTMPVRTCRWGTDRCCPEPCPCDWTPGCLPLWQGHCMVSSMVQAAACTRLCAVGSHCTSCPLHEAETTAPCGDARSEQCG